MSICKTSLSVYSLYMRKIVSIRLHLYFVALFIGYIVFVLPAQAQTTQNGKRDICNRELCGETIDLDLFGNEDGELEYKAFNDLFNGILPRDTSHYGDDLKSAASFPRLSFIPISQPIKTSVNARAPPVL